MDGVEQRGWTETHLITWAVSVFTHTHTLVSQLFLLLSCYDSVLMTLRFQGPNQKRNNFQLWYK